MSRRVTLLLWLLAWSATFPCPATAGTPQIFTRMWEMEDGLPENGVRAIAQTSDGFLWMGTGRGLARFDGLHFETFIPKNRPELTDQNVLSLCVTEGSRLWVGTGTGLSHVEGRRWQTVKRSESLFREPIEALAIDRDGVVHLGMGGDVVVRLTGSHFENLPGLSGVERSPSKFVEERGQIWLASKGLLARVENHSLVPVFREREAVIHAAARAAGGVWFTDGRRLRSCAASEISEVAILPEGLEVTALLESPKGSIWVGTKGRGIYEFSGGVFHPMALPDETILCLFLDRDQSLWAGTEGAGVCRIRPKTFRQIDRNAGLPTDVVTSVCRAPNNTIWFVLADNSVFLWDGHAVRGAPSELSQMSATCVQATPDGKIWLGTNAAGLYCWDGEKLRQFTTSDGLPSGHASLLHCTRAGELYVGDSSRLAVLRGSRFEPVDLDFSTGGIRCVADDESGVLWIGSGDGSLHRYFRGEHRKFGKESGLPGDPLRVIFPGNDRVLWIGTYGGGLCRWQGETGQQLGKAQGILDNSITQIEADSDGFLWCGTPRGIFRVEMKQLTACLQGAVAGVQIETFGRNDGLPSFRCAAERVPRSVRSTDGSLYFCTYKGLIVVDPDEVNIRPARSPSVFLEEIRVNGATIADVRLTSSTPLLSGPSPSEVTFRVTSPNLMTPEKLRFRFRLRGLDDRWGEETSARTASFHNLSPGVYTFEAVAGMIGGNWSNASATVQIEVPPSFWQRPLVRYPAFGLAAFAALAWIHRWALRRVRRRLASVEAGVAVERGRLQLARDMHDELGAYLTQISLLADTLKSDLGSPVEMPVQLDRISLAASRAVDSLDGIVWAVNPKKDSLSELVEYTGHYASEYLESIGIGFEIDAPDVIPTIPISAEVRHHVLMAIKESLQNVAKHSGATLVTLHLEYVAPRICISLRDNGRGFVSDDTQAGGDGLKNIRDRIDAIGGQCAITSENNAGVTVALAFTLG